MNAVKLAHANSLLGKARELIQRLDHPGHEPTKEERLAFLSESEGFLADACGVKCQYFKP